MQDKKAQRERIKERINGLSKSEREAFCRAITERALDLPEYKSAKVIFIYVAAGNEAETAEIIAESLKNNKTVAVPVIVDKDMKAAVISPKTEFILNKYNIKEPVLKNAEIINPADAELILAPLMGFDENLNRLGRGGGYYDKFLAEAKKAVVIGLGYELQKEQSIITEPHDRKLDAVVTETRIYRNIN
ncbi:MAG TPA: 5-formyltetrahydrofolate cyclo-ligase [Eubacteriales bacterium]|jgi:5-formyltetrahydrofolate cyclo-ligase|nr:5-formyltetrahydrofolate cyclo-ligase [Clostridia bacterium]HRR89825.1 5-formyltetrahydrofolate cyclo-ligase [Eubacteriales bacterium]HRU84400.1 5-formyltetrahydrofolate cyclo-ligase [Eubacteriales bacterium]